MANPGRSDASCRSVRSRGRPSSDTAAQIDREILEAARDLFFSQGYERTSMAMIVKSAGVSKTTLYARYTDKAQLFRATVAQTLEQMQSEALWRGTLDHENLMAGLEFFGSGAITMALTPLWRSYERLVFAEGMHFPELAVFALERIDASTVTISQLLSRYAERDAIVCHDPDAVAATYLMALRGFITTCAMRVVVPPPEVRDAFVASLVRTLIVSRERR